MFYASLKALAQPALKTGTVVYRDTPIIIPLPPRTIQSLIFNQGDTKIKCYFP